MRQDRRPNPMQRLTYGYPTLVRPSTGSRPASNGAGAEIVCTECSEERSFAEIRISDAQTSA